MAAGDSVGGAATRRSCAPGARTARAALAAAGLALALAAAPATVRAQAGEASAPSRSSRSEEAPMVRLETSHGTIDVQLDAEKAPKSVANFLRYVDEGFYDGTVFHRVIPGFMIQGGGMEPDLSRKETRAPIENEADNGLRNLRGTLAMARTARKDSATSQFFINLSDNAFLDHGARDFGYAVFGRVAEGMDVVDRIAGVETTQRGPHGDVPVEPVVIESARRIDGIDEEGGGR